MSFITADASIDEIEDWFKIGQDASKQKKPVTVASSALKGHLFDSETGGTHMPDFRKKVEAKLPSYRRNTRDVTAHQYVESYRAQEEQELLSQVSSDIIGRLSPNSLAGHLESLELDTTVGGGSVAVPDDLIPDGAIDVYGHYNFEKRQQNLPVFDKRETIVDTIESNQVTIIEGPTGSGKTTQVPQFILDHYAEEARYCNIIVTQPRKIAATSICRRVCAERGWAEGSVCGYQIGLERVCSEDTRILYCTTGVLKEKFIGKKNMHEFTHVILDEVHERDIETDFALLIVKKLLRTNSRHVKVILMSATIDTSLFANYFALPVMNRLEPAPVVTIGDTDPNKKVVTFYTDDLRNKLGEVPPVDETSPRIHPAMYEMAAQLVQEFDDLEIKEKGLDSKTGFAPIRGTVLIFLPGINEIASMQENLTKLDGCYLNLIPLHSTITISEQAKVFEKATPGYRKVILSTNIAESSLTIPDIKFVIDFCLTKNLFCDPESNYTHLQVEWASMANLKQRTGRAGRVDKGRCYRMIPQYFVDTLPKFGMPEMQRSPLETLILKTKLFDMGEPKALLALALAPPKLEDIERTILSLKEVGALSSSVGEKANPYDGDLTFLGHVLASLPVNIYVGKLLVLGHVFGMLEDCLIIGAAMSLKSIFATPFDKRLIAFMNKLTWSDNCLSDSITVMYAYTTWYNQLVHGQFQRTGKNERQFCTSYFLQLKSLREVQKLIGELEQRLAKFNIVKPQKKPAWKNHNRDPTEQLILKMVICGAFYPNYAVKEESDELEAVKNLSSHDPLRTVAVKGLPMNEGILYHRQIKDWFSVCCMAGAPPPKISTEESRAFIEFAWKPGKESSRRVHPSVITAIKTRQIGLKCNLDMLDKEETRRQLMEVQKASAPQPGGLRSNRLQVEDQTCAGKFLPWDYASSTIQIEITEVIECGHFWAQLIEPISDELNMQIKMALNGPSSHLKPSDPAKIKPGDLVAAPFMDNGVELLYRAKVEQKTTEMVAVTGGAQKLLLYFEVFFVDFGNREKILVESLCDLPIGIEKIPYLAREFYLKGIRPSSINCINGGWSEKASKFFMVNAFGLPLIAQVYSHIDDAFRVELVRTMPNGEEVSFQDELVRLKYAEPAEESFLSQQNHEWREAVRGQQGEKLMQYEGRRQVSISSNDSKPRRKAKKIALTGPTNPLEMTFSSITFSGRQRVVRIDPESVNCVAIDDSPEDKFSRLIVASSFSLNAAGNSMIGRDTTIMPQIPGLPALVTLLFSPFVEYRTDPKCTRYIGALCGLGYNEMDGAILPDHDIELMFETSFDNKDILMINKVRQAINISVGTNDSMAGWNSDAFVNIQRTARDTLLSLIKTPREVVAPQPFRKMYEWNQIDQDSILYHGVPDSDDPTTLLRLHNAVCLEEPDPTPQLARKKRDMVWHLEDLQRKVTRGERTPVKCELCNVQCPTSQLLAIHLQTESHQRHVTNFLK